MIDDFFLKLISAIAFPREYEYIPTVDCVSGEYEDSAMLESLDRGSRSAVYTPSVILYCITMAGETNFPDLAP